MAHNHAHSHGDTGNIRMAFFLNLGFTLLEFAGGIWTNSVAITADAVHDLGDSASLGLAWYLERYAQRGASRTYSYGYGRFSLLGALINAGVLIGGSLFVLSEAIPRILDTQPTYAPGMIGFAVLGILVNGAAVLRLRRSEGLNAQVVGWHLLEDVLGWVAVLLVSLVLFFVGDWYILDPLLSVLITLVVLTNAARNLRGVLRILLQAAPSGIDVTTIDAELGRIDDVQSTHHTHVWSLDGEHHVLTTHLVVNPDTPKATIVAVKDRARAIAAQLEASHITVEVEFGDEDCTMRDRPHAEAAP
ncbi:MAG: cation diffusion facilitator family transporter [Chloroflexi bacterium OHK40]